MEQTALLNPKGHKTIDDFSESIVRVPSHPVKKTLRVSIITVTYNSASTIRDTLKSVSHQTYSNIEHIIVDGGSSDHTLDIVGSFSHISKCISEKDEGIYDAMNKGLSMATGDIIGILNSDDMYAHADVIAHVVKLFETNAADTVYGDLLYVDQNNLNRVMRRWISGTFKRTSFKFGWMPPHPTFFVKKEVYSKAGLFNLSLKFAADYELMLRVLYKHQFNAAYLPEVMVKMRSRGRSNGSLKRRFRANGEDRLAWKLNQLHPYFFTLYLKPLRKVFQYINKEQLTRVPILNHLM